MLNAASRWCSVLDVRRAGSRYRFVESRKSRTVVKRGPVLACRSGGTRSRLCGVPRRRRDENADAETGIGTWPVPGPGFRVINGPRGHHVSSNRTADPLSIGYIIGMLYCVKLFFFHYFKFIT